MVRRARMYTTPEQRTLGAVQEQVNEFLSGIAPEDVISNQIIMAETTSGVFGGFIFSAIITYIGEVEEE